MFENKNAKLVEYQESYELSYCSIGEEGCAALISALRSNPSHLKELDLSRNKPGDSGVKLLSALLEDPHCKLEKLQLWDCSIGEEGCAALISALRSNSSHLRELDLSCNKPGDTGVKLLSALVEDPHCKLKKLWLCNCNIGEEGCAALISALSSNSSHLRELDLSLNKPGDSRVKLRSALLEVSHRGEPTEVNPGLFLDSPTDSPVVNPAFPTLREINIDSIQAPEPRTRDEFLQYACDLTLDPNTAHRRLVLSDEDTAATLQQTSQPYPDVPQRFDGWTQVLCLQPLSSDRCYWEVEWRGRGSSLGVVSGSMSRKGADSGAGLGYNGQSWSLELSDMCCAAMHANQKVEIPVTYSPRVGVFLDRTAGTLTFYSVDDELVPLHTFQGLFPPSLYAAFGVGCGVGVGLDFAMGQFSSASDSIKICPL
ncbi:ribonuclease inhibitor-like [Puntigrus tetrazona]|uniref:ribonuclease inhibitor-like n=1 Tax=Puntigrus tetrazona TaxID=1606681 RepID=UPI001C89D02A|nr:ribonuclease inhibitor-like [Puntigrus tetrazona]